MSNIFTGLRVEDVFGQLAYPLRYLVTIYEDDAYILDLKNIKATTNGDDKPIDANAVSVKLIFTTNTDKNVKENNWHYHFMRNSLYQILRNNYPDKINDERCDYVVDNTEINCEALLKIMNIYKISMSNPTTFYSSKLDIGNLYNDIDNCLFAHIIDNNIYEIHKDTMNIILHCIRSIRNRELLV